MAARKRSGLGKSIEEIVAETEAQYEAAGPQVPAWNAPLRKTKVGLNELFPTGDDFGPYAVGKADTYFQGPGNSTRVKGHIFVPEIPPEEYVQLYGRQFAWDMPGIIYVLFHKRNDIYQYGPCSLRDYRIFRESASKGRSIRALESFPFSRASNPPSELLEMI